jgi:uncharacterized protein (TIGR00255 family)
MIRSMTAFATREAALDWGHAVWELRSVNHRYLELSLRLPEEFRALDPRLREAVAARAARGKIDATLRVRAAPAAGAGLRLNEALAVDLARLLNELKSHVPDLLPGTRLEALALPGMILEPEFDASERHASLLALFDEALDDLVAGREREGERLRAALLERLDAVGRLVDDVRGWLPGIREALRAKLEARLAEINVPADPGRHEQELVLNLQKLDVDEELDRLTGHIEEARRVLSRGEAAGRRLDFLLQEFNREANTLGSKSVDARTTQAGVELKVLIEQMREQVQNIE